MSLRYVVLVGLLLVAGCGGAAPPQAERPTRLYLAGDGELWVVDVASQRAHRLARPLLHASDVPHRILVREGTLVAGNVYGDSSYILPSVRPDRLWVVDRSRRTSLAIAVREVTVGGLTTLPAIRPPQGRSPLAAVDGGLLLDDGHGIDVWNPFTGRLTRHLSIDAATLGPTSGHMVVTCTDPGCHALRLTDARTGASRTVRAPRAFTFEPWGAAFAPDGALLGVPVRVVADGPRQLALVDVTRRRVAVVPASAVSPGYTLVAWSAGGDDVFLTGGGAYATPRVLVGYRIGAPRAQAIHVRVGDFYDLAAI